MKNITKSSNHLSLTTALKRPEKHKPRESSKIRILKKNHFKAASNSKLPLLTFSSTVDKSFEEMKDYVPQWLITRDDFGKLYNKLVTKTDLNVGDICARAMPRRTDDEREAVILWLCGISFFAKTPKAVVRETCDRLFTVKYQKNELVMKKGEDGDCMFIIYKGIVGIYVNNLRVGQRIAGDVIGETAMDTEKPRIADVIAEESLVLLRLKKIDYKSILANLKRLEKYENSKFLMTIEFFSK